ncbi:MAG: MFS transporter [Cyanobacteria bacterium J06560_6]
MTRLPVTRLLLPRLHSLRHPIATFAVLWLGQTLSLLGSNLTRFAFGVWIYQQTQSVISFALIPTCLYLPGVLISPLAGSLTDRWNRRTVMLLSDVGSGVIILGVLALLQMSSLQQWHIYTAVAAGSLCAAFQWAGYAAATTQLIPPQQLGRANGMVEAAKAAGQIIGPLAAGTLLFQLGISEIITLDLLTFVIGVFTLLLIRIPSIAHKSETVEQTQNTASNEHSLQKSQSDQDVTKKSWHHDFSFGWQYIRCRPPLIKLLFYYGMLILFLGALEVLFTPFFLNLGTPRTLGIALSVGGIGWLLGSLTMSVWGGPKNHVKGIFVFAIAQGLWLMLAGFKASIPLTMLAIFGYLFTYPFISSCNQSLWQSHIPPEIQGRVFSIKLMVEWLFLPIGYLAAGVLSDRIFEPLMAINGPLSQSIGQLIGTGPGRGIALLCLFMGCSILCLTLWAIRDADLRQLGQQNCEI